MYLRFQYRIPKTGRQQPSLVAVVLESRRLDGKPRQRLVGYLGSITRADIHEVAGRHKFWSRVDKRLVEFKPDDAVRFAAALEAMVPRPTVEEVAALFRPSNEAVRRAEAINAARARMAAARAERATQEITS